MEKETIIDFDLVIHRKTNNVVKFFTYDIFDVFDDSFPKKFYQLCVDIPRQEVYASGERIEDIMPLLKYIGKHHYLKTNIEKVFVCSSQTILSIPVKIIQDSLSKHRLYICENSGNVDPVIVKLSPTSIFVMKKLRGARINKYGITTKLSITIHIDVDFLCETVTIFIETKKPLTEGEQT